MRCAAVLAGARYTTVVRRCALLEVTRSTYYAWCRRPPSRRRQEDRQLVATMQVIHRDVDRAYGSPRMHQELQGRGYRCGRHRVARLMRLHGLRAKRARRFRLTTDSTHPEPIAANLVNRQFRPSAPNRLWLADITYIPTHAGWAYLAVVLDAYSRRVVGWALADDLTTALPRAALEQALTVRHPPRRLIHHSDRGVQYASREYRSVLARHGLRCSMSRRGNCWDNAVMESFFASLKIERVHDRRYADLAVARADLTDYIDRFYNRLRRHSTLGYDSPVMYELKNAA